MFLWEMHEQMLLQSQEETETTASVYLIEGLVHTYKRFFKNKGLLPLFLKMILSTQTQLYINLYLHENAKLFC